MALLIAVVLFGVYVSNVVLGATTSNPILNDVQEMMLLFVAAVAFTVAILKRESDEKSKKDERP